MEEIINNLILITMEQSVNQRIKVLRTYLNLTQRDFADSIDSTLTTVSRLENGGSAPQISTIKAITRVFNVNKDWLLNGNGEMLINDSNPVKKPNESSWRDTAFEAVIAERDNLREMVNQLIMRIPIAAQKSFKLPSVEWGGSMNCNTGVRA